MQIEADSPVSIVLIQLYQQKDFGPLFFDNEYNVMKRAKRTQQLLTTTVGTGHLVSNVFHLTIPKVHTPSCEKGHKNGKTVVSASYSET